MIRSLSAGVREHSVGDAAFLGFDEKIFYLADGSACLGLYSTAPPLFCSVIGLDSPCVDGLRRPRNRTKTTRRVGTGSDKVGK
jgi:hypothetical protein